MNKQYWLLKSEPHTWSLQEQAQVDVEPWDGIRNYQARNNLRLMKVGDLAFFYHSGKEKAVVGIVIIVKEHYPDIDSNFSCVDVKYYKTLKHPVSLQQIRMSSELQNIALIKQTRLSVCPLLKDEFNTILKLSYSLESKR